MASPCTQMIPKSLATITCLLLIFSLPANSDPTAYDLIQDFGFPVGILPKGVTGYDLDESTGKFSLYMNQSCKFSLEGSYQLNYKPTVKGYISKGRLYNLEGVKVKILFLWVDIIEVDRSGDELNFSVGIASAGFGIENFEESPQCGGWQKSLCKACTKTTTIIPPARKPHVQESKVNGPYNGAEGRLRVLFTLRAICCTVVNRKALIRSINDMESECSGLEDVLIGLVKNKQIQFWDRHMARMPRNAHRAYRIAL
ncbi:hypothetical protein RJ639_002243 [Escallonia herrerae]|uniref:Uncharacterized protein n=1 Tax=Escallonia herrerae TaxID=1293975 RepID=A0AA88XGH0_9ASTE|nr:hypothetical protein RJ639_002243 [Escallonia herrerae]